MTRHPADLAASCDEQSPGTASTQHVIVAEVVRSGLVESIHIGSAAALDADGSVVWSTGAIGAPLLPRSGSKPIQTSAMVRAGLPLRGRLLALVASSHSGEPMHRQGVHEILKTAGLDETVLQTPAAYPVEDWVRDSYVAGGGRPDPIAMMCSGKHAGMLATCVTNGWPLDSYRDPMHPLQRRIASEFTELTGSPMLASGVDGCGAPVYATTLIGLARAFSRIQQAAAGTPERQIANAFGEFPEYISGTRREEAGLLRAFPGAVAKSGAEACYAVAMPDGSAVALKIADGGDRACRVVMAAILRRLRFDHPILDEMSRSPVLGGADTVGEIRAVV